MSYVLGSTRRGKKVSLAPEERSRHMHVLGASGSGKSKFLESLIRQDILAGDGGLFLIDPHGTLADAVVAWCASRRVDDFRRVHVLEPANAALAFGFNPLQLDQYTELSVRVDAMVAAFAQVWGGADMSSTPLLKRCLRALFYALAEHHLTLLEAPELLSTDPGSHRRKLTENLSDPVFDATWRELNLLSAREFREYFSSTQNRMLEFLSSTAVRRIIGQRDHTLDLRKVMNNREIVILNLARRGSLSEDNARLIGTLLTSEFFLAAVSRTEQEARRAPFYLYIDECYSFLTSDVEKMLDQTRKFGLHLVLSHQRLSQLGPVDEGIYNAVMTGGQTKVVFGGLADNDAELMAREIMRSSINLERPKHVLDKPVVIDEIPYWLDSESVGESATYGRSTSSQENRATTNSQSHSYEGPFLWSVPTGLGSAWGTFSPNSVSNSVSTMEGGGSSSSENSSFGRTEARGRAQTLKPVRQIMPTAVYSLDEEMHLAILKLRELPNQSMIVKRRGRLPVLLRAANVQNALTSAEQVARFKERTSDQSPYIATTISVSREISERELMPTGDRTPKEFWLEEPA